ncbi:MAG: response regulator [Planctomycetes bacterium]|nr:response regulator [Planctomycetota bacterium]
MSNATLSPEHELLAQVAQARHELRTPVNALMGYCEMLLEDAGSLPYPRFQAGLQEIQIIGRRLNDAINELLTPSPLDSSPPDLAALASLARRELRPHGEQILRVGGSLLSEAQTVPLSAFLTDLDRILAAAYRFLSVLNESLLGRVKGRPSVADSLHAAESGPLPSEQENAILAESAEMLQECRGHVLIVDDNPFNRDILARGLLAQRHHFALAGHGKQALDMLASKAFDLVLLDILMPEMDGFEVLSRMRTDPDLCHTPVIVISAPDQLDNVVRCLELGACDYLPKPFDPVLLRSKVESSLELKRLRELERGVSELAEAVKKKGDAESSATLKDFSSRSDSLGELARLLS